MVITPVMLRSNAKPLRGLFILRKLGDTAQHLLTIFCLP
jgi:hypothetical protein